MSHTLHLSLCVGLLSLTAPASGANRYFFANQTVPPGATGFGILLRADMDQIVYGFSFGVSYDQTHLQVTEVNLAGTSIPPAAPDFFDGTIDPDGTPSLPRGLIGYGCVLDFGQPFADVLPPGTDISIANLVTNTIGAQGTSSQLRLETVPSNPDPTRPVKNVMTDDMGDSVVPTLVAGTITIENRTPMITMITGNSGGEGTVFQVKGTWFTEPGLLVKVCNVAASATLQGDGMTLDVTAPPCGSTGFAPLEVSTVRGSDVEANGFDYQDEPPVGGIRKPSDCNHDGRLDISDAICLLGFLFLGSPTTLPCGDGSRTDPGNRTLLNGNNDAGVDLSDAVYVLSFLFSGGPAPFIGSACTRIVGCTDGPCL